MAPSLTRSEKTVLKTLSQYYEVIKGSYPDFLVYDKKTRAYCFVEVKQNAYQCKLSNQARTIGAMEFLKLPVYTWCTDYRKAHLKEVQQRMRRELPITELQLALLLPP